MSDQSASLLSGVLELPSSEREQIAGALWDSIDAESSMVGAEDSELAAETSTRREEIFDGTVKTISHADLKRQLGR